MDAMYRLLLQRVYEDDEGAQRYYLSMVETQRHISVDYLIERGCMFIPNNDYITHYLGNDAYQWGLEFYRDDRCLWTLFVLIPVTDLSGEVVGLVGWDAQNKYKEISEGAQGLQMYSGSSKNVYAKEKFFLSDVALLKKRFPSRTIFITDGAFDSISLNYHGIPALALLGSTFSTENLYFLRWYRNVFVCADNDPAGSKLYRKLKSSLPNVHRVWQGQTKDIEELLRRDDADTIVQQFQDAMQGTARGDIYLKI